MARRPRDNDDDVSLFPFLSIIACVIGVLTMMISTLALAQMDNDDVALIEAHEKVSGELDAKQQELDRLRKLLEDKAGPGAATVQQDISTSEQELAKLVSELEQIQKELAEQEKVKVVIPTLDPAMRESVGAMAQQRDTLTEELAQLEKELSERREASESRTSILPSGSGVNFKPHFIECQADAIVLHTMNPPKLIRAANMVTDEDFLKVLERVANSASDSVIFLLRSDALNTWNAARGICNEREIRNGKLPVVGKGRIDLSAFATN